MKPNSVKDSPQNDIFTVLHLDIPLFGTGGRGLPFLSDTWVMPEELCRLVIRTPSPLGDLFSCAEYKQFPIVMLPVCRFSYHHCLCIKYFLQRYKILSNTTS